MQNAHPFISLPPALAFILAMAPALAFAAGVQLPEGATLTKQETEENSAYALPVGVWEQTSGVPSVPLEGQVVQRAWRIGGTGMSSYQILANLRRQVLESGYEIIFECEDSDCGGFDFRFGTRVIGEPAMHVDLGDFHFLSATREGEHPEGLSLLVSRSVSAGFVQITEVGPSLKDLIDDVVTTTSTKAVPGTAMPGLAGGEIGEAMEVTGRYVLADLVFATGSADLGPGHFASLVALADYLKADPTRRVALVGHTDAQGSLSGNTALSKRRATSVMQRLVNDLGVRREQLEAEGIGYLAPIASNQSDGGRAINRRVEAVLIPTR
ncbi:MAG: cell envelope biogenesis protein OmpA [Rhodobacterales bacterium]|nr:MAG: cell envelope biogenesis protein OmpA [Rhodobacterales bacterium]